MLRASEQRIVNNLTQQGMPVRQPREPVLAHQISSVRLVERPDDVVHGPAGGDGDQVDVERIADDGGHLRDLARRCRETGQFGQQHGAHRRGLRPAPRRKRVEIPASTTAPARAASAHAQASRADTQELNEAGTYLIYEINDLAPGASFSNYWNDTPQNPSHRVDVWPEPNAGVIGQPCKMEVVRTWKSMTFYFGPSELELHWTVKNVGTTTCDADVYLIYVNP